MVEYTYRLVFESLRLNDNTKIKKSLVIPSFSLLMNVNYLLPLKKLLPYVQFFEVLAIDKVLNQKFRYCF